MNYPQFQRQADESPADHLERLQRHKDQLDNSGLHAAAESEALSRAIREAKQAVKGMTILDQLKRLWAKATAKERQAFFLWYATQAPPARPPARAPGRGRRKE
jgi:hypothetical protein